MRVYLNEYEVNNIRIQATMRQVVNLAAGVQMPKITGANGRDLNFDGLLAEAAFGKWQNIYISFDNAPRKWSFDGIWKTLRADVKSVRKETHDLITGNRVNEEIEVFISAVIIADNEIEFRGWYPAVDMYDPKKIGEKVQGNKCYIVKRAKLKPFWKIKTLDNETNKGAAQYKDINVKERGVCDSEAPKDNRRDLFSDFDV